MFVSKNRFTFTPLPSSILDSFRKSIFGVTPAVKPTTLQKISSPVSSIITDFTRPFLSDLISFKFVLRRKSIWCSLMWLFIISDSCAGKTPFQKLSSRTKKVTGIFLLLNISANSIPIKPPPTITALLHALLSGAYFSNFSKSCL